MSGPRLPVVRIPTVVSGDGGDGEGLGQEEVVVELPTSNKFNIAWPAEQPSQVHLPLGSERPVALSSSEGETDASEDEVGPPVKRSTRPEDIAEDPEFITPTNHLNSEQNPMDQAGRLAVPRLSRAFSMPLPSQLSHLQNPRRPSFSGGRSPSASSSSGAPESEPELEPFRELSLELADSVQMVIQTLLQLSPPQVLDPAKEQFSACSLSIPTPSISAMFTTMKNLNYISANMSQLTCGPSSSEPASGNATAMCSTPTDFDVGEMLQSVGDALSGVAAEAGVDLVLFHSDVGMRHVAVKGDESGLSYALSHVLRQVIGTAQKGDTVEVGLYIGPTDLATVPQYDVDGAPTSRIASPTSDDDSLVRCNFRISHRLAPSGLRISMGEDAEDSSVSETPRDFPSFDTLILQRLLKHIGASLTYDQLTTAPSASRVCVLSTSLEPGEPSAVNPSVTVSPEDAAVLGYPDMHIADEPTLEQLTAFAETLRGKSVTLYASTSGSFAHHLSSYLTAWGMDVSHLSTEPGTNGEYELVGDATESGLPTPPTIDLPAPADLSPGTSTTASSARKTSSDPVFVLIDDDVAVLRSRLQKIKAEQAYPLNLHSRKRPSLASNHRPRSSPQVARVMGMMGNTPPAPQVVIVHFTSLANFKLVKDAIQSILTPTKESGVSGRIPEVIVIPKPAGPRRFLTALHTAVTRPVVDPYFVPTATSPMSPGLHSISPFFNMAGLPKSPSGRSTTSVRTSSDRATRSPKDAAGPGEYTMGHAPPSPLSQSDNIEYFSDAVVKLGTSPATGLLIQSPDGQPTGIFFHPKAKGAGGGAPRADSRERPPDARDAHPGRHRAFSRVASGDKGDAPRGTPAGGTVPLLRPSPRATPAAAPPEPPHADAFSATVPKGKARQAHGGEDSAPSGADQAPQPPTPQQQQPVPAVDTASPTVGPRALTRRQSHQAASPPTSPQTRATPGPPGRRLSRRPTTDAHAASPGGAKKAAKASADGNIVPPVSVLIVDDNPINQTILTTFMRKKKIKYDVAKNGEEAVQKWHSGTFHLILMDIQMPVMDGIQATKEIRRLEKQAGSAFPSTPQSEGQRTPSEASTVDSRSAATPPYRSSVIIVALTASSLQADRVAALAAGCNDFLTKPVSLQWLNSKIIEWGSIKALQMWADIRPEVVRSITTGQNAQAQQVARRLHVPEGRSSPAGDRVRSTSMASRRSQAQAQAQADALHAAAPATPNTPLSDDSPPGPTGHAVTDAAARHAFAANIPHSPFSNMTASEAALTLAGHRVPASVDDRRASSEGRPPDGDAAAASSGADAPAGEPAAPAGLLADAPPAAAAAAAAGGTAAEAPPSGAPEAEDAPPPPAVPAEEQATPQAPAGAVIEAGPEEAHALPADEPPAHPAPDPAPEPPADPAASAEPPAEPPAEPIPPPTPPPPQ